MALSVFAGHHRSNRREHLPVRSLDFPLILLTLAIATTGS